MFCKNQQIYFSGRGATEGQNKKMKLMFSSGKEQLNQELTYPTTQNKKLKNSETYDSTNNLPAALYWKNSNSCEFMGAHARSSAHGCPWTFMVVHACVWVYMCFCLFVVLFCCHPLSFNLKKLEMEVPALG